jgi:hypothetical protein
MKNRENSATDSLYGELPWGAMIKSKAMNKAISTVRTAATLATIGFVVFAASGCGSSENTAPPTAYKPPQQFTPPDHAFTKEEKIARIKQATMPEDQKKAAIAQVEAGKL